MANPADLIQQQRTAACPSDVAWLGFLQGAVSHSQLESLCRHLEGCANCSARIDSLSAEIHPTHRIDRRFLQEPECRKLLSVPTADLRTPRRQKAEPKEECLPEKLGRFDVQGLLGSGGFGRVYLAYDPKLNRTVAIKVPYRSRLGTDADFADFLNEARLAAALDDHPGIVKVHDVVEDNSGRLMIVMKHINGRPLSVVLKEEKPDLSCAVKFMIRIAEAIHFAHERGFLHRDLKPANVLIDENDQVFVADLGLGLRATEQQAKNTPSGGTVPYMAPERLSKNSADRRSDIWSLGIMLAELVHGWRPFREKGRHLVEAILSGQPTLESTRETSELDAIAKRCLAKDPDHRIQTAAAFAEELQAWQKRNSAVGPAKWKFGWRRNLLFALVPVLLVVILQAAQWKAGDSRLTSTLDRLKSAPSDQIAGLVWDVSELADAEDVVDYPPPQDPSARFRISLCRLVIADDSSAASDVLDFSESAEMPDIQAIIDVISQFACEEAIGQEAANRLLATEDPDAQIRLAAVLAGVMPGHAVWPEVRLELARLLVSSEEYFRWLPLLVPVADQFRQPLQDWMAAENIPPAAQVRAAKGLAEFFTHRPEVLAPIVVFAEPSELKELVVGLRQMEAVASSEIRQLFEGIDVSESTRMDLGAATQKSRLAVAAWLLNETTPVCVCLKDLPDPTLRTLTIHGLAEQEFDNDPIWSILNQYSNESSDHSAAIKSGLLLLLKLLPDQLSSNTAQETLRTMYREDPDPGVHSAVQSLAKRTGQALSNLEGEQKPGWMEARIGDTVQPFSIIGPCRNEVGFAGRGEIPLMVTPAVHHMHILSRRIAVATTEVTNRQYTEVMEVAAPIANDHVAMPVRAVTLQNAFQFCNRCSEAAQLELCYEPRLNAGKEILWPKRNHPELSGYRLPTSGEWELACRAGTVTDRSFGQSDEFANSYAFMSESRNQLVVPTGEIKPQRVGKLLPNRWGLFDMYGNVREILVPSKEPETFSEIEDAFDSTWDDDQPPFVVSGLLDGSLYAKSWCRTDRIMVRSDPVVGFRIVRTLVD